MWNKKQCGKKTAAKGIKLTLEKAIQIFAIHEVSEAHNEKFQAKSQATEVHNFHHKRQHKKTQVHHRLSTDKYRASTSKSGKCQDCGYEHAYKCCPAFNKRCNHCGKWNHFESMCLSKQKSKKNVHNVDVNDNKPDTEPYASDAVQNVDVSKGEIFATIVINKQRQKVKIDTGEKCNVMSDINMQELNLTSMLNTQRKIQLIAYGRSPF